MPRRKYSTTKTAWWLRTSTWEAVKQAAAAEQLKPGRLADELLSEGLERRAQTQRPLTARELEQRIRLSPGWDL
jgi:hypothetical protein